MIMQMPNGCGEELMDDSREKGKKERRKRQKDQEGLNASTMDHRLFSHCCRDDALDSLHSHHHQHSLGRHAAADLSHADHRMQPKFTFLHTSFSAWSLGKRKVHRATPSNTKV
jgi:hypothetical protein